MKFSFILLFSFLLFSVLSEDAPPDQTTRGEQGEKQDSANGTDPQSGPRPLKEATCKSGDCEKQDYSSMDFEPYSGCLDAPVDPKDVVLVTAENSENCNQNPFMAKVKAFACSVINSTVQEIVITGLEQLESNPIQTLPESYGGTIKPCEGLVNTCCDDTFTNTIRTLLKGWVDTQGQRKPRSMMALGNMDKMRDKCRGAKGEGGPEDGSGEQSTTETNQGEGGNTNGTGDDPDNGTKPSEGSGDNTSGGGSAESSDTKPGEEGNTNGTGDEPANGTKPSEGSGDNTSGGGDQGVNTSEKQGDQGQTTTSDSDRPAGARQNITIDRPKEGRGGPNMMDAMSGRSEMAGKVKGMLKSQSKILIAQLKWLRASVCALCVDPQEIETYFENDLPKFDAEGIEKFKDDCQVAFDEQNTATSEAAEQFVKEIAADLEEDGDGNKCSGTETQSEMKDYVRNQGFDKTSNGTNRTAEDFCAKSLRVMGSGVAVDESVEDIELADSIDEVTVPSERRRLADDDPDYTECTGDSCLTSYAEDDDQDSEVTVDNVDENGVLDDSADELVALESSGDPDVIYENGLPGEDTIATVRLAALITNFVLTIFAIFFY